MRIDQAARLAIGSRDRRETGLRVVERIGDQLRVECSPKTDPSVMRVPARERHRLT
jgi:hypothetical protein